MKNTGNIRAQKSDLSILMKDLLHITLGFGVILGYFSIMFYTIYIYIVAG